MLETPLGADVYLGFDFATVEDLVALARTWWIDHKVLGLHLDFWMPEEGIKEKEERWRVPLRDWVESKWIRTTPGRTIDTATLRWEISGVALDENGALIKERNPDAIAEKYNIVELAFDRAHAHDLVILQLGDTDGLPVVEHGQGFISMSSPSKTFKKYVNDTNIRHNGNPCMDWQVSHCVVDEDPAGNIKPNKKKSRHKIDGIVASVMSVGRAVQTIPEPPSVYSRRGVIAI